MTPEPPRIVIYACSGCSDAGELADRTARQLSARGSGQMSCLAGIGGRVQSLVRKAELAEEIVVIDGCPLNCARHTLELAGFSHLHHLELHRLGLRKGNCPVTPDSLELAVNAGADLIRRVSERAGRDVLPEASSTNGSEEAIGKNTATQSSPASQPELSTRTKS